MIRVKGLCKSYGGDHASGGVLRDLDVDIADGEFVAVTGRSGCGKTTLLNIVAGLDVSYLGEVMVGPLSLRALGDVALSEFRNRVVGFVFQTFHLLPHLSCADNVALPSLFARGQGAPNRSSARRRAGEMLERVGLSDRLQARPGDLSGGERQRVALARALFSDPRVLLCDELTGNLDETTSLAVLELLQNQRDNHGTTVVVATHDRALVSAVDRTLRLIGGRLLEVDDSSAAERGTRS